MNIIIFGPQASGKGTQSEKICDFFKIPHISTGDIFRDHIKRQTELGKKAQEIINAGALMPDEITNKIILDRLTKKDCENGFLLDGFPRNKNQAKFLEDNFTITHVLQIKISDDEAIKRIGKRRICTATGRIFIEDKITQEDINECKNLGGNIIIRDDDKEEAVKKRLKIYHEETEPLVNFYKEKEILCEINGEQSINDVFNDVLKCLKE